MAAAPVVSFYFEGAKYLVTLRKNFTVPEWELSYTLLGAPAPRTVYCGAWWIVRDGHRVRLSFDQPLTEKEYVAFFKPAPAPVGTPASAPAMPAPPSLPVAHASQAPPPPRKRRPSSSAKKRASAGAGAGAGAGKMGTGKAESEANLWRKRVLGTAPNPASRDEKPPAGGAHVAEEGPSLPTPAVDHAEDSDDDAIPLPVSLPSQPSPKRPHKVTESLDSSDDSDSSPQGKYNAPRASTQLTQPASTLTGRSTRVRRATSGVSGVFVSIEDEAKIQDCCMRGTSDALHALAAQRKDGRTLIASARHSLYLAARHNNRQVIRTLLDFGVPVDGARSASLETALMGAVSKGHLKTARLLLREWANPDLSDRSGRPSIVLAAEAGHPEMVKLLLEYGASFASSQDLFGLTISPLITAIFKEHVDVVRYLLQHRGFSRLINLRWTDTAARPHTAWEVAQRFTAGATRDEILSLLDTARDLAEVWDRRVGLTRIALEASDNVTKNAAGLLVTSVQSQAKFPKTTALTLKGPPSLSLQDAPLASSQPHADSPSRVEA